MNVKVIKEHPLTKGVFPLGFETTCESLLSKEDKVSEGFWTGIRTSKTTESGRDVFVNTRHYVEPKTTPKGTYIGAKLIGSNGVEYDSDWFYRSTGRAFSEFFEKL